MTFSGFLSVFESILHAAEAAAKIAAPIVETVDPTVGALILQATDAAVGVEAVIVTAGSGARKAALVRAQTQATVDVINGILAAQHKTPAVTLPAGIADIVQQQVQVVVAGLNTVQQAVEAAPAVKAA
jgi:hypothetical protein